MWLVSAKRFALFGLVWLILSRGDSYGLTFGVAAAAGATWLSLFLLPAGSLQVSFLGLLRLLPGFLRSSLLGGIDVARRALHPRLPIKPGWIAYRTKLPPGLPRVSFGSETTLLPGSLVAGGRDDVLYVHVLDTDMGIETNLQAEEERIASVISDSSADGDAV